MGHARVDNICKVVNRKLKEGSSIQSMVDDLILFNQKLHAGEGDYDDPYMLAYAVEEIINLHRATNLVRPYPRTADQRRILRAWSDQAEEVENWDSAGEEYRTLHTIMWHTTRKRLPFYDYMTN